jgi:hypothetical protein
MDVLAAYREVGSYRGAADICGTTHKTVRRIVQAHEAGGAAPARKDPANRAQTQLRGGRSVRLKPMVRDPESPRGQSGRRPRSVSLSRSRMS